MYVCVCVSMSEREKKRKRCTKIEEAKWKPLIHPIQRSVRAKL